MVGQLHKHTSLRVIGCAFVIILLAGCAVHKTVRQLNRVTVTDSNVVYNFQYGHSAVIKPEKLSLEKNDQLALMPGGPYVYQQISLNNPPVTVTTHNQYAYVITQDTEETSKLLIIQFPVHGNATLVNSLHVGRQIVKSSYAKGKLLLADKSGQLTLIDVTDPDHPVQLLKYMTREPVSDLQFNGESAYILQGKTLIQVKFTKHPSGKYQSRLLQQWQLPLQANSFAVREKTMWTAGLDGIAVIKLDNKATLSELIKTTGTPVEIKLVDDLALITDVKGGMVVFDVSSKEKVRWFGSYNKRNPITHITLKHPRTVSQASTQNRIVATMKNNTVMSISINNPRLPSSGPVFKADEPIITNTYLADDVLIATRHKLQRVKMEDAGNYSISPEGTNMGGSRRGVIRNNILYVADWFSGLHLYDISDPQHVRHLSNYHTPGSSKGVALFGDYVLVGDDDQGLQIVDIRNPLHPTWVSELSPEAMARQGLAYTMKRVGDRLYLADHRGGFHIIDLSDIQHPRHLGGYDTPGKSWGIEVSGKYVFVADDQSGLLVFDAGDNTSPRLVAQFDPDGQAEDVVINGNRAYVVFFDKGLYVLDISNPLKPKELSHTVIPGNARGIVLADKLAYVTGWESGLHILDINGDEPPRIISSFDTDGSAWGVNIQNGFAYVLDWWGGIKVIDVRNPSNPVYVSQYHAQSPLQRLRARDRYIYAANGSSGLQVFDIKNPLNPIWVTGMDLNGQAQDVWHDDNRTYVATGDGGVAIVDTLDPFYTLSVNHINTPGVAQLVRAWNSTVFIKDSKVGLLVVDDRKSGHAVEISRIPIMVQDLWVDDNAFLAATRSGLSWWRHDGGYLTKNRHNIAIPGGASWVRTQGDSVITAQKDGRVQLWHLTSQGLSAVSDYTAGEPLLDIQASNNTLYLLGKFSGLMVIDIHDPGSPRLNMTYPATGPYTGIEIAGGAAFFTGENKLASVTLLPSPRVVTGKSGVLELQLPANLPIGSYHLLKVTASGKHQLYPNAVQIHRSNHSPGGPILEKYRQMLKSSH